jgi:hypothetical protein
VVGGYRGAPGPPPGNPIGDVADSDSAPGRYILVYPQGCDVSNHLSLFLCVADYDKLRPGWSHFAQFTVAVVNREPRKSKYSDTLHRFCRKEHDWGWKKFTVLDKLGDGFLQEDRLVIKAQVQVLHERPGRPFSCLEAGYRRELVRVYLSNVEAICRKAAGEAADALKELRAEPAAFRAFWAACSARQRADLAEERGDVVLRAVARRFFNEKEVTSTLVMDALHAGCRALSAKVEEPGAPVESEPRVCFNMLQNRVVLRGCLLTALERCAAGLDLRGAIWELGEEVEGGASASGRDGGGDVTDARTSAARDERRLALLGRRCVEAHVVVALFAGRVGSAYREALALQRQEALIAEEEAAAAAAAELNSRARDKKARAKARKREAAAEAAAIASEAAVAAAAQASAAAVHEFRELQAATPMAVEVATPDVSEASDARGGESSGGGGSSSDGDAAPQCPACGQASLAAEERIAALEAEMVALLVELETSAHSCVAEKARADEAISELAVMRTRVAAAEAQLAMRPPMVAALPARPPPPSPKGKVAPRAAAPIKAAAAGGLAPPSAATIGSSLQTSGTAATTLPPGQQISYRAVAAAPASAARALPAPLKPASDATSAASPPPAQPRAPGVPGESPGLSDFPHMRLIDELLWE